MEVQIHAILTLELKVSGQLHDPTALSPEKEPPPPPPPQENTTYHAPQ